jgi:hypothetical protein
MDRKKKERFLFSFAFVFTLLAVIGIAKGIKVPQHLKNAMKNSAGAR